MSSRLPRLPLQPGDAPYECPECRTTVPSDDTVAPPNELFWSEVLNRMCERLSDGPRVCYDCFLKEENQDD